MEQCIFADLHNHTRASDGDLSPGEMVARARNLGIGFLGITDHDTLGGLAAALAAGDALGVRIIPGVEVSVRFQTPDFTGTLHLLCYFPREQLGDKAFVHEFSQLLSRGRGEGLVRARMDKINRIFGPSGNEPILARELSFEDLSAYGKNLSRRHFALALEEKLGITDPDLRNRIIANNSPAYLPSGIDLSQLAPFLFTHPILPILAHPAAGSFPGKGHYKEVLPPFDIVTSLLPRFLDAGLRGLEVHYPGHTPELEAKLVKIAAQHGLLVTGGSDCHGDGERPPGVAGMDKGEFDLFMAAFNQL